MKKYQQPIVLTYMLNNEDVVTASTPSLDNYGGWNSDWDEIFKSEVNK